MVNGWPLSRRLLASQGQAPAPGGWSRPALLEKDRWRRVVEVREGTLKTNGIYCGHTSGKSHAPFQLILYLQSQVPSLRFSMAHGRSVQVEVLSRTSRFNRSNAIDNLTSTIELKLRGQIFVGPNLRVCWELEEPVEGRDDLLMLKTQRWDSASIILLLKDFNNMGS